MFTKYIFLKQVPTDAGMCCAFNRDEADKIFIESKYSQLLKIISQYETNMAFERPNEASGKKIELFLATI
jgi:hypothetical protein